MEQKYGGGDDAERVDEATGVREGFDDPNTVKHELKTL